MPPLTVDRLTKLSRRAGSENLLACRPLKIARSGALTALLQPFHSFRAQRSRSTLFNKARKARWSLINHSSRSARSSAARVSEAAGSLRRFLYADARTDGLIPVHA